MNRENKSGNRVLDTYLATVERSSNLEKVLKSNPQEYRMLSGDRPTGALHIGHLFGSLESRVRIQDMGVESFVVIADYQVLTDRQNVKNIDEYIQELTVGYLAAGLDPEKHDTFIFPQSHVPELNQLLVPFLSLVTNAELNRNPTVKEEIRASGAKRVNAAMYTYPVHQAADILFCKANVVPVGKDQLPHIELTRQIARRFNRNFGKGKQIFPMPESLLSNAPFILGLDGLHKMSKSRNNAILISANEDETARLIRKAKTDKDRNIEYLPQRRPEIANLLNIASFSSGTHPEQIANEIGAAGAAALKERVIEDLNTYLRPIRERRLAYQEDNEYISDILEKGIRKARAVGSQTLYEVREAMNMQFFN
jgi:tryptophanyl-tRNA synthetase